MHRNRGRWKDCSRLQRQHDLGLKQNGPGDKPGFVRFLGWSMREYFKGWRRKVGCVCLVLGCGLALAWLRSFSSRDHAYFRGSQKVAGTTVTCSRLCVTSETGAIIWTTTYLTYPVDHKDLPNIAELFPLKPLPFVEFNRESIIPVFEIPQSCYDDPQLDWEWRFLGFGSAVSRYSVLPDSVDSFQAYFCPYWAFVFGLSCLSICLLLWKPRKVNSTVERI